MAGAGAARPGPARAPAARRAALKLADQTRYRVERSLPGQVQFVDNLSDSLNTAAGDSLYAQALYIMLAVPGALIALGVAYLAALGTSERDRRDLALLRAPGRATARPAGAGAGRERRHRHRRRARSGRRSALAAVAAPGLRRRPADRRRGRSRPWSSSVAARRSPAPAAARIAATASVLRRGGRARDGAARSARPRARLAALLPGPRWRWRSAASSTGSRRAPGSPRSSTPTRTRPCRSRSTCSSGRRCSGSARRCSSSGCGAAPSPGSRAGRRAATAARCSRFLLASAGPARRGDQPRAGRGRPAARLRRQPRASSPPPTTSRPGSTPS